MALNKARFDVIARQHRRARRPRTHICLLAMIQAPKKSMHVALENEIISLVVLFSITLLQNHWHFICKFVSIESGERRFKCCEYV